LRVFTHPSFLPSLSFFCVLRNRRRRSTIPLHCAEPGVHLGPFDPLFLFFSFSPDRGTLRSPPFPSPPHMYRRKSTSVPEQREHIYIFPQCFFFSPPFPEPGCDSFHLTEWETKVATLFCLLNRSQRDENGFRNVFLFL